MKEWFMYKFFKKMYLQHDGMRAEACYRAWVDIRTLKLGKISPWGNTYYAYSKPDPMVTQPGSGYNPLWIMAHNRWILRKDEYDFIKSEQKRLKKKAAA